MHTEPFAAWMPVHIFYALRLIVVLLIATLAPLLIDRCTRRSRRIRRSGRIRQSNRIRH